MPSYVKAIQTLGIHAESDDQVQAIVRRGIPATAIDHLSAWHVTADDLRHYVEHPEKGTLTEQDSAGLLKLAYTVNTANEAFGDREQVLAWLRDPQSRLGGRPPIVAAAEDGGVEQIDALFSDEQNKHAA